MYFGPSSCYPFEFLKAKGGNSGFVETAGKFFDECKKEKKIIVNELSEIFKNSEKINRKKKHEYDKSGKSFIHQTLFDLISGDQIRVECYDWSKKMTKKYVLDDQLIVSILHKDFSNFLTYEAYK